MNFVMHSYGPLPVSLRSFQVDEAYIKMSTRKDLLHFLKDASCVCGWLIG